MRKIKHGRFPLEAQLLVGEEGVLQLLMDAALVSPALESPKGQSADSMGIARPSGMRLYQGKRYQGFQGFGKA
jgi:hypothetical protein